MGAHDGCVYRGDCFIPFSLQQSTDLFVFTMDFTYTYACINYDQSTNIIYGYVLNPTHAGNRRVWQVVADENRPVRHRDRFHAVGRVLVVDKTGAQFSGIRQFFNRAQTYAHDQWNY